MTREWGSLATPARWAEWDPPVQYRGMPAHPGNMTDPDRAGQLIAHPLTAAKLHLAAAQMGVHCRYKHSRPSPDRDMENTANSPNTSPLSSPELAKILPAWLRHELTLKTHLQRRLDTATHRRSSAFYSCKRTK